MKPLFLALLLSAGTAFAQEDPLITVLKAEAPLNHRADACQELARVAPRQAVPVLAALLSDEQLSHRARSVLEPIVDPAVDVALRQALGRLQGRLLVGVIHSLGVRRDAQAVEPLATLLSAADPEVAQAAARALGNLGPGAIVSLEGALTTSPAANLPAVCEGLFRCAETLTPPTAAALYDRVRTLPNLPHHLRVAALGGAIRTRGTQGLPLMIEALRTPSSVPAADVIRMASELPGPEVTRALAAALDAADEPTRVLLLQALGHRGDATASPALVASGQKGPAKGRVAAIQSLVQIQTASSLPALVALSKDPTPEVAGAAWAGLVGWPGQDADAAVASMLGEPDTRTRIAAMGAVAQRRLVQSIPALLQAAGDADARVAGAGFKALGELAGLADLPGVVNALLVTKAQTEAETALLSICERQPEPATCANRLLPGLARAEGEAKLALLRTLGSLAGPQALDAMRTAAGDAEESVRDTASRALCDWPTADVLPDLNRMMRGTAHPGLRSLALRGQLRLIPLQTTTPAQQAGQIQELLPIIEQMKEQRLALSTLAKLHGPESLGLTLPYLSRAGFKDEANIAAVTIAEALVASHPADAAAAMQRVDTANTELARRVRLVLDRVPPGTVETGFIPIFNGRDLTGWDGKPGWWTVEDGALTAESTPAKPCPEPNYLVWRGGQPADFELLAEFRLTKAGNSGIQLRSRALPNWDTSGYQADMTGDGELVGFVYEHARGLIAGRGEGVTIGVDGKREASQLGDAAELVKSYRQEAWNTYRIVCRGPEITLFINGRLMCQFTDRDPNHAASKGFIALQMHPGPPMKIAFRNIRLKELPPPIPEAGER